MHEPGLTLLSMSAAGSILIMAVLAGQLLWRKRLSRCWQYYIWLVVVARLLWPIGAEDSLMGRAFGASEPAAVVQIRTDDSSSKAGAQPMLLADAQDKAQAADQGRGRPFGAQAAWTLYLLAAVGLLVRRVTWYQSFVRYTKAGMTPIQDVALLDEAAVLAQRLGVRRPIELGINPQVSAPLVVGLWRPCIVLAEEPASRQALTDILWHELTHCRRMDMLYKWLVQAAVCLHWFNPLVHIMSREIDRCCELSCDEAVAARLDKAGRRQYGQTLLDAMPQSRAQAPRVTLGLGQNKKRLQERLWAIMHYQKKSRVAVLTTVLLTAALLCGFTYVGALPAQSSAQETLPDIERGGAIAGRTVYFIYTAQGLDAIGTGEYGLDKFYMLQRDIDLTGKDWQPIGTEQAPFTGQFDGNSCTLWGLGTEPLFSCAQGAVFHNITFGDRLTQETNEDIRAAQLADWVCAEPRDCEISDVFAPQAMEKTLIDGQWWYLVTEEAQLRALAAGVYPLDGHYRLCADLALSPAEWRPIGSLDAPFTGSFDGNGHTLSGLTMTDPEARLIGLFGYARGAVICRVTMTDYDILSAGRSAQSKSVAPILAFGQDCRSFDNTVSRSR